MKKNILYFVAIFSLSLALFSCKKDETKVLATSNPTIPIITFPGYGATINVNRGDTMQRAYFQWNAQGIGWDTVKNGMMPVINYSIQCDTLGGNFKNPFVIATTTADTFSILYGDLNKAIIKALGITAPTIQDSISTKSLEIRIVATLATNSVQTSSSVPIKATTWIDTYTWKEPAFDYIWVAGDFPAGKAWQGPIVPLASPTWDKRYETYINFTAAGQQMKSYGVYNNWGDPSWGDGGNNALILADCACSNWSIPAKGLYQVCIKLDSMKSYLNPVTWSILGGATPGGWSTDTDLTPDALTGLIWTTTCYMSKDNGDFKFRANHSWDIDYAQHPAFLFKGKDMFANRLVHSNNKWVEPYDGNPANIKVPANGNYKVTLDLSVAGKPTYSLVPAK